jgi:hypothetical protein
VDVGDLVRHRDPEWSAVFGPAYGLVVAVEYEVNPHVDPYTVRVQWFHGRRNRWDWVRPEILEVISEISN